MAAGDSPAHPDQTQDGEGWVEILKEGAVLFVRGKTGWREIEVGRGSSERTCPVAALETWIEFARLAHGPVSGGCRGLAP